MAHDHGHSQGHEHGHEHGHAHDHAAHASRTRLGWAAAITGLFMLAEVIGGYFAGSLALLADAGHMLTDFAALAFAWVAAGIALRPADRKRTYGFDRITVLAAFINGVALFVIAAIIIVEAIHRFFEPVEVAGGLMLEIAVAGLVVNIVSFVILHGGDRESLNMRGAALHVLGDLFGSVAAIVAGLIIMVWGWMPADPLLSVVVALIILRSGWAVVRESGSILLEAAPGALDDHRIEEDLARRIAGVENVHHVHVWSISEKRPMATMHVRLCQGAQSDAVVAAIKERLEGEFGIGHSTIEVEFGDCADDVVGHDDLAHEHHGHESHGHDHDKSEDAGASGHRHGDSGDKVVRLRFSAA